MLENANESTKKPDNTSAAVPEKYRHTKGDGDACSFLSCFYSGYILRIIAGNAGLCWTHKHTFYH